MFYSKDQKRAFGLRRAQAVANPETPGESYVAVFGYHPDSEELGEKLCGSAVVKKELDATFLDVRKAISADLAGLLNPGGQGFKELVAKMVMLKPSDASMDNPLCDTKVLRDGSLVAVAPDKTPLLNLLGKALGITTSDTNITINLPTWKPTVHETPEWKDAENVIEIEPESDHHSEYYAKLAEAQGEPVRSTLDEQHEEG